MICPECNHNQLRGQHGMTCRQCSYEFIFDPKKHFCGNKNMTDGYFIKCVNTLSRYNTYYYTKDELYCYMAQKTKPNFIGCFILSILLSAFISAFLDMFLDTGIWPAFILFLIFTLLNIHLCRKALSLKAWNKLLSYWQKRAKKYSRENVLAGLLYTPQLTEKPNEANEPDIYDYGASKLLICQHDIQVDWLVMNNFHTQNRIVIVAESGYPHYLTDQVKLLLDTNPKLEVFLLHNASVEEYTMLRRLQQNHSNWNVSQHECIDFGLTHEQVRSAGVKKNIIEHYKDNFPVHALNYHNFNRLLTHSVANKSTLGAAIAAFAVDSDSGVSCDFG